MILGRTTERRDGADRRQERRLEELRSAERTLIVVRWVGVLFAAFQIAAYAAMPYPPGVRARAYGLVGLLVVANLVATVALRRVGTVRSATLLAVAMLAADTGVVSGIVWLYAFDEVSVHFLLLFVLPAEAALKFQLKGALALWATVTAVYSAREAWAADRYGFEASVPSVTYRMGILLIVSLIVGLLARNLLRRTEELAEALAQLRTEEQWRTALIDMLAHDLRSPLGSATSALLIVERRLEELSQKDIRRLIRGATRQNRRGLSLADDLLTLSRAREGHLPVHREQVAVGPLLTRLASEVADEDDWADVDVPAGLKASVDPARVEQVVSNLLSNARKYGRPPVTVTARGLDDGGLEIRVSDCGEGVPEEYLDSLFDPFVAGPRRDSVGLGLWVVDVVAHAHGGDVVYTSNGGYPTFVVTLPGDGSVLTGGTSTMSPPGAVDGPAE